MVHFLTRRGESETEVAAAVAAATKPYVVTDNFYYDPIAMAQGVLTPTTLALTADRLYATLGRSDDEITFDGLYLSVTGAAAAGKLLKFSTYQALPTKRPGAKIADIGQVLCDSTGFKTVAGPIVLPAGYWFIAVESDGTPTVAVAQGARGLLGGDGSSLYAGFYQAHTFGTAPDPFSTTLFPIGGAPRIWGRI